MRFGKTITSVAFCTLAVAALASNAQLGARAQSVIPATTTAETTEPAATTTTTEPTTTSTTTPATSTTPTTTSTTTTTSSTTTSDLSTSTTSTTIESTSTSSDGTTSTSSTASATSTDRSTGSTGSGSKLSGGAIAGIVIGSIGGLIFVSAVIYGIRKANQSEKYIDPAFIAGPPSEPESRRSNESSRPVMHGDADTQYAPGPNSEMAQANNARAVYTQAPPTGQYYASYPSHNDTYDQTEMFAANTTIPQDQIMYATYSNEPSPFNSTAYPSDYEGQHLPQRESFSYADAAYAQPAMTSTPTQWTNEKPM